MNHAQYQLWRLYFNSFIMGTLSQEKFEEIIQDDGQVLGEGQA